VAGGGGTAPPPVDDYIKQQIQPLIEGIFSNNLEAQYNSTMHFRKLLSIEKNPPIQAVIQAGNDKNLFTFAITINLLKYPFFFILYVTGAVPQFIHFLQTGNANLQFEAAWALTNIASGSSEQTHHIVHQGAVPVFINLLLSPSKEVSAFSIFAVLIVVPKNIY
jgi:importin subunit alpha-1